MFSSFFPKPLRIVLFPFALLYWLIIAIRNLLYDRKIFRSSSFGMPLICVGNLSVGGTGKSPMVEYLVGLLKDQFKIATLSRGYKRKTKGYALANKNVTALEIGDEPMLFHIKFPEVPVAVGEERLDAISQLLHDRPGTEAIILDDAFQHRAIKAGLNIILTDCNNLFTRDFYLPTGDLRDQKSSYKRAQLIIVTKCDPGLTREGRKKIIKEINPGPWQDVFFTAIEYSEIQHIKTKNSYKLNDSTEVLLVTGIANPKSLKAMLEVNSKTYSLLQYPDHHIFTIDDLRQISKRFKQIESPDKIILTTEKDAVRLIKFDSELTDLPLFVIPVRHDFLFGEEKKFNELVIKFIQDFRQTE
jgi:tetraacyldisaccharide 4'-kinase